MKWIGAVAAVAALCTGCGSSGSTKAASVTPTPTISPSVTQTSAAPTTLTATPVLALKLGSAYYPNYQTQGKACHGVGGFSDLRKGRAVTIYDQHGGNIVGTGFIKQGLVVGHSCYMGAIVKNLPRLPFYKVQFANRNKVPYSEHDLITHAQIITIG